MVSEKNAAKIVAKRNSIAAIAIILREKRGIQKIERTNAPPTSASKPDALNVNNKANVIIVALANHTKLSTLRGRDNANVSASIVNAARKIE